MLRWMTQWSRLILKPVRLETRPAGSGVSHPLRRIRCADWSYHWGACPSCPLGRHTRHLTLWRWCSSATSSATWHGSHTQRHCLAGPCRRGVQYVIAEKQIRQASGHFRRKQKGRGRYFLMCQHYVMLFGTDHEDRTLHYFPNTDWQTYSSINESKSMKRSLGKALMLLFAKDLETTAVNQYIKWHLLRISWSHFEKMEKHDSHILWRSLDNTVTHNPKKTVKYLLFMVNNCSILYFWFGNDFKSWNIQVSQVPESSEGIFGCSLHLITLNEPVENKKKPSWI